MLDPGSGEAAFLNGLANVVQASNSLAIQYLRWARTAAPNNATAHYHLGNAAFLGAKVELSESATHEALRLGYSEAKSRFLLGRIHRGTGRHGESAREFNRAVELDRQLAEPRRMVEWTVTMEHFRA